jgi:hypothetical protein
LEILHLTPSISSRLVAKIVANSTKYIGTEPLDLVKFICKEFWEEVFKKKVYCLSLAKTIPAYNSLFCAQVDKLQTNHRGVFVLSDVKFKWLERYSSDDMSSKQTAVKMLHFVCGMLRGALANLGVLAIINADFNTLPACIFNVRIKV